MFERTGTAAVQERPAADSRAGEHFSAWRRTLFLSLLFFVSGAAALLFETLWFRFASHVFGSAAWASAIVLGSFMAGLAIGNWLSIRLRTSGTDPLRLYGRIELGVAGSGLALVYLLPLVSGLLAPLFRAVAISPVLLNAARFSVAFALLAVPTSLMGATLPTLVRAMLPEQGSYTGALALLYGGNTLGAVAGSLAGELFLIRHVGLHGTGIVAALASATAAAAALLATRRNAATAVAVVRSFEPLRLASRNVSRLLAAAFLCGFVLLALEVLWIRLLSLFVFTTSLAFALMLAVILAGIGCGSLLLTALAGKRRDADSWAAVAAAAAALLVTTSYVGFAPNALLAPQPPRTFGPLLLATARLAFPVSFLSGMLFPWIGKRIERLVGDETVATAALTAANTVGAMLGSAVAAFVLIPYAGLDASMKVAAFGYVAVTLLLLPPGRRTIRVAAAAAAVAAAIVAVVTPTDLVRRVFVPQVVRPWIAQGAHVAAIREGLTETAVYLRKDAFGVPYSYRLCTNAYSMSGTAIASKRYMSLFAHFAVALRPEARSALLISYGVGVTAHALVSTPQLQSIDVVDISPTILKMSSLIWPGRSNPLSDPRVRVHVEDGRFFLMTTGQRFDIITAEPPPPKAAGVVNLYTREYFSLIHDRLRDGGVATYWLPVYQLSASEAKSITAAFCDALEDCTLWSGAGAEWMLVGRRGRSRPPAWQAFRQPWDRPASGDWLRRIGVESPELAGTLFLGDEPLLRRWISATPPLVDDYPLRLSDGAASGAEVWRPALAADARRRAFAGSAAVQRTLPPEAIRGAMPLFGVTQLLDERFLVPDALTGADPAVVAAVINRTHLRDATVLLMGIDRWYEDLAKAAWARGDQSGGAAMAMAIGAIAGGDEREIAASMQQLRGAGIAVPELEKMIALTAPHRSHPPSIPARGRTEVHRGRTEVRRYTPGR